MVLIYFYLGASNSWNPLGLPRHVMVLIYILSGYLKVLEPSGLVHACNDIDLTFI